MKEFNTKITRLCTADNKSHMRFLVNADKLGLEKFFDLLGESFSDKLTGKTGEQIREEVLIFNF
jgi:hypothetical protein